jgi:hypothetical protein
MNLRKRKNDTDAMPFTKDMSDEDIIRICLTQMTTQEDWTELYDALKRFKGRQKFALLHTRIMERYREWKKNRLTLIKTYLNSYFDTFDSLTGFYYTPIRPKKDTPCIDQCVYTPRRDVMEERAVNYFENNPLATEFRFYTNAKGDWFIISNFHEHTFSFNPQFIPQV